MIRIDHIDHLVLTVADMDRSCRFYSTALGMTVETFETGRKALRFGNQKLNLHETGHEIDPHARMPTPGSADICLIAATPLADVIAHFANLDIPIEAGPVGRTGAQGPITSVYIRDPDGNLIEVSNEGA